MVAPTGKMWYFKTSSLDIYSLIFRAPTKGQVYAGHGNMIKEYDSALPLKEFCLTGRKGREMIHYGKHH